MQRREDGSWGEGEGSGVCEAESLHCRIGKGLERKAEDRLKYFFSKHEICILFKRWEAIGRFKMGMTYGRKHSDDVTKGTLSRLTEKPARRLFLE